MGVIGISLMGLRSPTIKTLEGLSIVKQNREDDFLESEKNLMNRKLEW